MNKEYMPIALIKRAIDRKRLKNENFSLITPNCLAGIIYHNLRQAFRTPTINLRIGTAYDYYNFCANLKHYLSLEITEEHNSTEPFPVGLLGEIRLYFNHYKTFEEAVKKWEERKKRLDLDNLYIITQDWVSETKRLTREEVDAWGKVKCKKLIMFTQVPYNDIPYTQYIGTKKMRNLLITNKITGLRGYETTFDYVKWLNT